MKKIYALFLLAIGLSAGVYANPGDTTIVQAQHNIQLDWPAAAAPYDSLVSFPNGSTSYRKIIMDFTLGKYDCGGTYNAATAGDTSKHPTWCGDWDYDIEVYVCTPTDTVELGRLITPYANSTMASTPSTWSHIYQYDVTDIYPYLKNNAVIRVKYNGYSGGFSGDVKFLMIEGTRSRDVVAINGLWNRGYSYGSTTDPIATAVADRTLTFPTNAVSAEMQLFITGHGAASPSSCSEFCKKWYQFKINDALVEQTDIWRDDCGSNFVYPQSGTWVYNRGNWCPGDLVRLNRHKVPATVTPGSNFMVDLDFQSYSTTGDAQYKLGAAMIFYGAYNHTVDAGIENIVSPTDEDTYNRMNPICGGPVVNVKNFGSQTVTSINFSYGISGQTPTTYTWQGTLAPGEMQQITLANVAGLTSITGTNTFTVNITSVNGAADQDSYNNSMSSQFTAAPNWDGGNFVVDFKMSSGATYTNMGGSVSVNKVNWTITDNSGNVLFQRQGTAAGAEYKDTLHLDNGCYKLNLDCSYAGVGLSNPYNVQSAGFFKFLKLADGSRINIDRNFDGKTSPYQGSLEGWVGNGWTQDFRVTNSVTGIGNANTADFNLLVYPNPAKDMIQVSIYGNTKNEAKVQLINLLGQVVYSVNSKDKNLFIATNNIANGIYTLIYTTENGSRTQKVVISK